MAVNSLSLAECLRPWRNAGLFQILGDGDIQAPPLMSWDSDADAPPPAGEDAALPPMTRAAFSPAMTSPPARRAAAPAFTSPAPGETCASAAARRTVRPQPGAAPGDRTSAANGDTRQGARTPEHWPGAWQSLFARTKAAPLIWTYPELGADLCGQGSTERSAFLRSLLGDLRLPRGSSAFWPLRLPDSNADGGAIFKDGLFRLRPKILIMLGPRSVSLSGLPLSIDHPFTQEIAQGLLVVLLPDFTALLSNAAQADASRTFLRAALSGMALGGTST